jgi:hypothetical protein
VNAKASKYDATASAAGYIFQARLALAEALRFAYADSGIEISVERLDDVAFERDGEPLELLQTKHHIKKVGDLTDASPDLWKTLRIWAERVRNDPSLPGRVRFALVTTAVAPEGTAAAALRPATTGHVRNSEQAAFQLAAICISSKNVSLQPAFAAFSGLAPQMQRSLLDAVDILDRSPTLDDLDKIIEQRLKMIAPRGKASAARQHLEGWWWPRLSPAS